MVDVGGFDAFVAEPKSDRRDVDAAGPEQHRVGVSECVRVTRLVLSDGQLDAAVAVCFESRMLTP